MLSVRDTLWDQKGVSISWSSVTLISSFIRNGLNFSSGPTLWKIFPVACKTVQSYDCDVQQAPAFRGSKSGSLWSQLKSDYFGGGGAMNKNIDPFGTASTRQ